MTLMKAESDVDLEYFGEEEIAKMHMTPNQITLLMPVIK